jgi:superoxide dismutase, Cu-Zn family
MMDDVSNRSFLRGIEMNRFRLFALSVAALSLFAAGCSTGEHTSGHGRRAAADHARIFADINHAVAVLQPTQGSNARGTVHFYQQGDNVRVVAEVAGLNPNQEHGFHVHEFGDLTSTDGMAAGGHYNPEGHPHGKPNGEVRHAGDFGNLKANANGVARADFTVSNITIAGLRNPIVGRGVIVHRDRDDGSQPLGNAGPRIAQGIVGIAQNQ